MAQNQDLSMTTTTTKITKKKKRKRPWVSAEEQLQQEQQEKYDKLVHMATKALHKEAKVVKSFECQKIVRKLKQQEGSQNVQDRLNKMKKFPLDQLVEVCLQRLGIPNLNPNPKGVVATNSEESKREDDKTEKSTADERQSLERVLQHKRLVTTMESWNEKVADYRRWYLRRQERVSEEPEFVSESKKRKKKKDLRNSKGTRGETMDSSSSELFVCLSGTKTDNGESNYYGSGAVDDEYSSIVKSKKKNRPGQRSRKAKAMAIQARKEGRTWDHSLNWREKKTKPKSDAESSASASQNTSELSSKAQPQDIVTMGKTWKEEGQAHPSWAARQSQKSGIAEFAGTKITFD